MDALKLLGALLLAATTVGCGDYQHEDECTMYIDPTGMSPEEVDVVVSAVEEWNVALDGLVEMHPVIGTPRVGTTFPHVIRVATEKETDYSDHAVAVTMQHITIQLMMPKIRQSPLGALEQLKGTTLHELGHHLGLDHSRHEDSLMYPNPSEVDRPTCITQHEVEAICQQFHGQCEGHDVRSTCEE